MQNVESVNVPHPIAGALYRTRICKFGNTCQYGDRCFYAHSDSQIRPRTSPTSSLITCKHAESVTRSSRRSSAVLSDINYELTRMSADSYGGISRRVSVCSENAENRSIPSAYSPSRAQVKSTLIPPIPALSACSCESGDTSSFSGSLSPISVSTKEVVEVTPKYSYYYACVRYLLAAHQPAVLAQILHDAAPTYYLE